MTPVRLAIVAEHRMTAEAIRRALRHAPACEVIGYVDARRSCGVPIANARADVILLDDAGAPELTLERVRELRAAAGEAMLILLTAASDAAWLAEAAEAGVDAAIGKAHDLASVGALVREILAGNLFHSFPTADTAARDAGGAADLLTPRELEILRLVASGAPNSRVAAELWVTEQTVKFHLSNVYQKLGVANRTEASRFAHLHGLLDTWSPAPLHAEAA
jgi:DNA-binding NarL/FixJ family response regulator